MKLVSVLPLLLFVSLASFSQSPIKITGKVIDSLYQKPVEYASITVTDKKTGKTAGGSISDNKGAFTVTRIRPGV